MEAFLIVLRSIADYPLSRKEVRDFDGMTILWDPTEVEMRKRG